MECEKARMASAKDSSGGQSAFFGTVITKFTQEGFSTLRTYLSTSPDVKNVMNLLLRRTYFVDAGLAMAMTSMDPTMELRERRKKLLEASRVFGLGKDSAFQKTCTDEYIELLDAQEVRHMYHELMSGSLSCVRNSLICFRSFFWFQSGSANQVWI